MAIDISQYKNVIVLDHPLITHKITQLRDKNTKTNQFKVLVKEVSILEGYEALRHLNTKMVEIETPIEKTLQPVVDRKHLCFVPILRAGLGMADGMLDLVPGATCGHIGLYRDEVTKEPVEYYCKLPADIDTMDVYLIDPMPLKCLKSTAQKRLPLFASSPLLKVLKHFVNIIPIFHFISVLSIEN